MPCNLCLIANSVFLFYHQWVLTLWLQASGEGAGSIQEEAGSTEKHGILLVHIQELTNHFHCKLMQHYLKTAITKGWDCFGHFQHPGGYMQSYYKRAQRLGSHRRTLARHTVTFQHYWAGVVLKTFCYQHHIQSPWELVFRGGGFRSEVFLVWNVRNSSSLHIRMLYFTTLKM